MPPWTSCFLLYTTEPLSGRLVVSSSCPLLSWRGHRPILTRPILFLQLRNQTGWPDGISWLLGLLQGGLGVTAFDAVAHMIEEIPHAASEGPKIMVVCVGIGTLTGAIFLIVLLFVSGNIDDVIGSSAGPLLQILIHATKSNAGAICSLSKRSTSRHGTDLCSSFPGYRWCVLSSQRSV
ncbi:hypothetical protein J3459_012037 [Metarhizium acridum]|nr:hypothetical protein J3459_012037 [Metarhizium acridum]